MIFKKIKDKKAQNEVEDFINLLIKHKFYISRVILFGSYAKGKERENSDIDIAVVSPDFGQNEISEMMLLSKLSSEVSDRIEPIPINDKLMQDKYEPLVGEIQKYGQTIFQGRG